MRQKQKGYGSLRLAVIGGNLTAENIKKVAEVAEKYGRGYVHMTSRQGIEIPFIKVEELAEVKEELAKGGVGTGVCGPRVRTITACQGSEVCPSGCILRRESQHLSIFMRRRNGRGFALRGGRSTRSQTGLAPGASAAHRRRMADEEKPKRKRAVARQASNPLEAAEKRGVPGGLQRGPRRGGAPNRPLLPPREAATLRGRENARRRSREPSLRIT